MYVCMYITCVCVCVCVCIIQRHPKGLMIHTCMHIIYTYIHRMRKRAAQPAPFHISYIRKHTHTHIRRAKKQSAHPAPFHISYMLKHIYTFAGQKSNQHTRRRCNRCLIWSVLPEKREPLTAAGLQNRHRTRQNIDSITVRQ